MIESRHSNGSINAVVYYEILKGIGGVIAAIVLWTWHSDLSTLIDTITAIWSHQFGSLFRVQIDSLTRAARLGAQNWQLFMVAIVGYASLRFLEAYGLWTDKTWAYWLSVLGYGLFVPVEVYYLVVRPFDWFKLFILVLNIAVVIVVYKQMKRKGIL